VAEHQQAARVVRLGDVRARRAVRGRDHPPASTTS
jgi:hypothetical protein